MRRPVVVLDPGHGGNDGGAVGYGGKPEKVYTLDQAREVALALWRFGYAYQMTRTGDYKPTFQERTAMAGTAGFGPDPAACFVSIHWNAYDDPDVRGTLTLHRKDHGPDRALAERILEEVAPVDGEFHERHDRVLAVPDPQYRNGLVPAMLKTGDVPSVLLESQFATSPEAYEAIEAEGGRYYRKLAYGVAVAIDRWWTDDLHRRPPTPVLQDESGPGELYG